MARMTFKTALDNLTVNYGKYMSRDKLKKLLQSGLEHGFSVNEAYNGVRMAAAEATGEHEVFTIQDVCEITGESEGEVIQRIREIRSDLQSQGINPDDILPEPPTYKYTVKL